MVDYHNILAEGQDLVEAARGRRPPYFREREIQDDEH